MKSIDAGRFAVGWQGLSRELGGLSSLPNRRDLVFLRFERPPTKRIPVSKIKNWLPCFLAMALTPAPAMADQVVGNLSSFVQGAPSFGDQYLGVVIDAPSSTSLTSFQWLNLESGWYSSQYNSTPSINFGASLYRWDPVANQTVGSAIWAQSGLTLSLPPGPSDLYPVVFDPPHPWIRKTVDVNSPDLVEGQPYLFYVRYDNSAANTNSNTPWCSWNCMVYFGVNWDGGVSGGIRWSADGLAWSGDGYPGSLAYQANFVSPALVSGSSTSISSPSVTTQDSDSSTSISSPSVTILVSGSSTSISSPSVTTLGGGTLVIDAPGVYGASWSLEAGTQSTIDLSGHTAAVSGVFGGPGGLSFANSVQTDTATVYLDGANTYTGSTVIGNQATVGVNGSIATSSGLIVSSGGTVGGTGILPGTTVQSGGTLAPGKLIGTLSISGPLTLSDGSISNFEVGSSSADKLIASGAISLGGVLNLLFTGGAYDVASPFVLFSGASLNGAFSSVTASGELTGYSFGLSSNATTIQLTLNKILETGMTTPISSPWSTMLAGGTLMVDAAGTYASNWTLVEPSGVSSNTIDQNAKVATLSGALIGYGAITFVNSGGGGGETILTGASTYTGATTIANGTKISVNGSIATSSGLTIQSGGTIGGNGQLPATNIATGGVIAPGNSIGTLTINGNYSLNGGIKAIEIQGPQNDQIVVTGTVASFTGAASLMSFGGGTAWPALTYTVVSANSSAPFATFNSLTLDQSQITPSALLKFGTTLIQEADGNSLTFDVQWRPNNSFGAVASAMAAPGTTNGNGSSAAGLFDKAFNRLAAASAGNTNATGAAIGVTGFTSDQATAAGLSSDVVTRLAALLAIPGGAQLMQAVNSVTPESYAAFQSVGLNALRLQSETITSQAGTCKETGWLINVTSSASGSGNKSSGSSKRKLPLCVFATGGNATSTINSSGGLSGYDSAIAGGFYGIELQPNAQWTLGAAYGYGTAALSNLGAGFNSVSSTLNSASLYGVYKPDNRWNIKTLLGYANAVVNGQRNLIAIGNGNSISGNTSANGYTAALLADYAIPLSKTSARIPVQLKPQLGLAYGAYQQNGFSETGDPAMNLNVASHTSQSLIGTVGAELVAAIALNPATTQLLKPRLAVAYQVDALANSNGNTAIDAVLPAASSSFSTNSLGRGANDVTVSGSLEYVIASKASLYATASYEAFSTGSQFAYGGGVKLSF